MQIHRPWSGPVRGSSSGGSGNFTRKRLKVESTVPGVLISSGEILVLQENKGHSVKVSLGVTPVPLQEPWSGGRNSSWLFPTAEAASLHPQPCLAQYPVYHRSIVSVLRSSPAFCYRLLTGRGYSAKQGKGSRWLLSSEKGESKSMVPVP